MNTQLTSIDRRILASIRKGAVSQYLEADQRDAEIATRRLAWFGSVLAPLRAGMALVTIQEARR